MSDTTIADIFKEQFANAFDVLVDAIPQFTEEEWRKGRSPFDGPCRAVAHALQCGENYTTAKREVFTNLGKEVWQMETGDLPSQQSMAEHLERVRAMTMAWIDEIGQLGFRKPTRDDGVTGLERVVYALRHLQHHAGEVCCWQKQFDHPQDQWK